MLVLALQAVSAHLLRCSSTAWRPWRRDAAWPTTSPSAMTAAPSTLAVAWAVPLVCRSVQIGNAHSSLRMALFIPASRLAPRYATHPICVNPNRSRWSPSLLWLSMRPHGVAIVDAWAMIPRDETTLLVTPGTISARAILLCPLTDLDGGRSGLQHRHGWLRREPHRSLLQGPDSRKLCREIHHCDPCLRYGDPRGSQQRGTVSPMDHAGHAGLASSFPEALSTDWVCLSLFVSVLEAVLRCPTGRVFLNKHLCVLLVD